MLVVLFLIFCCTFVALGDDKVPQVLSCIGYNEFHVTNGFIQDNSIKKVSFSNDELKDDKHHGKMKCGEKCLENNDCKIFFYTFVKDEGGECYFLKTEGLEKVQASMEKGCKNTKSECYIGKCTKRDKKPNEDLESKVVGGGGDNKVVEIDGKKAELLKVKFLTTLSCTGFDDHHVDKDFVDANSVKKTVYEKETLKSYKEDKMRCGNECSKNEDCKTFYYAVEKDVGGRCYFLKTETIELLEKSMKAGCGVQDSKCYLGLCKVHKRRLKKGDKDANIGNKPVIVDDEAPVVESRRFTTSFQCTGYEEHHIAEEDLEKFKIKKIIFETKTLKKNKDDKFKCAKKCSKNEDCKTFYYAFDEEVGGICYLLKTETLELLQPSVKKDCANKESKCFIGKCGIHNIVVKIKCNAMKKWHLSQAVIDNSLLNEFVIGKSTEHLCEKSCSKIETCKSYYYSYDEDGNGKCYLLKDNFNALTKVEGCKNAKDKCFVGKCVVKE